MTLNPFGGGGTTGPAKTPLGVGNTGGAAVQANPTNVVIGKVI